MISVDEEILCLDVSVDDTLAVEMFDGFYQSLKELFHLTLFQSMFRLREYVLIQRVSSSVLNDKVYLLRTLYGLNDLGYCRMVDLGLDRYFPLDIPEFAGIINLLLLIDFDGYFVVPDLVVRHPDCSICPLPQLPIDLVVIEFTNVLCHNSGVVEKSPLSLRSLALLDVFLLDLDFVHEHRSPVILSQHLHHIILLFLCSNLLSLQ